MTAIPSIPTKERKNLNSIRVMKQQINELHIVYIGGEVIYIIKQYRDREMKNGRSLIKLNMCYNFKTAMIRKQKKFKLEAELHAAWI